MRVSRHHFAVWLGVVFVAALALRVGVTSHFVGLSSPPDFDANPDQIDYEMFAYQMSIGKGYSLETGEPTARRAPGTSLILLPVYKVFGHSFAAGRLWMCLLSALTCLIVGWIGKACFGPVTGLIAAAWLAVYPGHFYYTMHFVSETPYGFWLAAGLALTIVAVRKPSLGANIAAGVCWAMAVLTRPPIIFALPVALLLALLTGPKEVRLTNLKRWAIQACVIIAVMSPWVARNAVVMGKPTLVTISGLGFWGSNNALVLQDASLRGGWVKHSRLSKELRLLRGSEIEKDATAWRYGLEFVQGHLPQMPALIMAKLYRLVWPFSDTPNLAVRWAFALAWMTLAPFLVIGLVQGVRRAPGLSLVLMLPLAAIFITAVIYYGSDRFRDSCASAFIVFAALGLVHTVSLVLPRGVLRGVQPRDAQNSVRTNKNVVAPTS